MNFKELGLMAPILRALAEQSYTSPTPIQAKAIPPALAGRDVLGCAQTGTGKTCAFAAPILQRLCAGAIPNPRHIRALILTPTRELAIQIQDNFEHYGKHLPLRSAVIFGGVGQQPQVDKIKKGLDILVATPGRLLDLQGQGFIDLSRVEIFVLDEADRMLDMGFIHDVRKVLKLLPQKKQTLFFSATMPPEVMDLVNGLLHDPVKVAVDPVSSPVEVIRQSVYFVDKGNKSKLLAHLITQLRAERALVFTRTKHGANKVAGDLTKAGISAAAIHGNKSQTARVQALTDFKAGRLKALVATDIAARGIDIEELPFVFNYNLPEVPETYVHRIGRTGRAGHEGSAVSFCDFGEKEYLKGIEKLIGRKIPAVENHPWPMEIFETAKDAKGRPVNADDAEARAAARERKALRRKGAATAQVAPQTAPIAPSAPQKAPKALQKAPQEPPRTPTVPNRPKSAPKKAVIRPEKKVEKAPQIRPNLWEGEVFMDATARFLAPKKPQPQPEITPRKPLRPKASEQKPPSKKPPRAKAEPKPKPQPKSRPESKPKAKVEVKARKPLGRKPFRAFPSSSPAQERVKDSTQQESLMKPYYLSDD